MGNYADWGDVTGRYPKVSSVADDNELQDSFIAGAEAVINAYLAKQFSVPIAGKPVLLTDIAIDLTYAKVMVHKDKAASDIHDKAMTLLGKILDGEILLLDGDGNTVATLGNVAWSTTQDYHDSFSMLGTDDRIDETLLEDLASDRA